MWIRILVPQIIKAEYRSYVWRTSSRIERIYHRWYNTWNGFLSSKFIYCLSTRPCLPVDMLLNISKYSLSDSHTCSRDMIPYQFSILSLEPFTSFFHMLTERWIRSLTRDTYEALPDNTFHRLFQGLSITEKQRLWLTMIRRHGCRYAIWNDRTLGSKPLKCNHLSFNPCYMPVIVLFIGVHEGFSHLISYSVVWLLNFDWWPTERPVYCLRKNDQYSQNWLDENNSLFFVTILYKTSDVSWTVLVVSTC